MIYTCQDSKRRSVAITPKQLAILRALLKRNDDGSLLDIQQLIAVASPNTTKAAARGAMICSLRHLAAHDLVCEDELVLRRGRWVRTLAITDAGKELLRPAALPAGGCSSNV